MRTTLLFCDWGLKEEKCIQNEFFEQGKMIFVEYIAEST